MDTLHRWSDLLDSSLGIAVLAGVLHAVVVLLIRTQLSVISTPLFDPFVLWAFTGLTIVGAFATYVYLTERYVMPALGISVYLGWIVLQQVQYVDSLNGLAWSSPQPLGAYILWWHRPLLLGVVLAVLEWGERRLIPGFHAIRDSNH